MPLSLLQFFIIILLATPIYAKPASFQPRDAYLGNLEDDDAAITVFSNPKTNWKNCTKLIEPSSGKEYCKEALGWPDRNSKIKIIGPDEVHRVTDPFSGEIVNETFVKIWFRYSREVTRTDGSKLVVEKEDVGYLPKSVLTFKKQESFFSTNTKKVAEPCEPAHKAAVQKTIPALQQILKTKGNQQVVNAAEAISKAVGKCLASPPTRSPQNLPSSNIYDALVLPQIRAQRVPHVLNEKNQKMTQADLINIDSLARTLYGEMGGCFRKGLQYPMAVARVALNRAENQNKFAEYTGTNVRRTNQPVPVLTKILTTPEKFNNWKSRHGSKPNGPLHQSLCPPTQVGKPFWKEDSASREAADVWKNSVRIATEAVMFPTQFKARAPQMKGIHFYTSGMGRYGKSKRLHANIDGRPVDNGNCIELWSDPPPRR